MHDRSRSKSQGRRVAYGVKDVDLKIEAPRPGETQVSLYKASPTYSLLTAYDVSTPLSIVSMSCANATDCITCLLLILIVFSDPHLRLANLSG